MTATDVYGFFIYYKYSHPALSQRVNIGGCWPQQIDVSYDAITCSKKFNKHLIYYVIIHVRNVRGLHISTLSLRSSVLLILTKILSKTTQFTTCCTTIQYILRDPIAGTKGWLECYLRMLWQTVVAALLSRITTPRLQWCDYVICERFLRIIIVIIYCYSDKWR